jgi:glyoxylate/hydroxypyruvate reductase A
MIDADALAALPEGALLINVARGDLVDQAALLDALDRGHLRAAVLDVFTVEPLPPESPQWSHPRIVVTPHIAAPSEVDVIADEFADNYLRFVAGAELINVVDRGRGY